MTQRPLPGRTRRACGHLFVAVASLLIGYSAWAAQPVTVAPTTESQISAPTAESPAALTTSSSVRLYGTGVTVEDVGGSTRVAGPKLRLVLDPGVHFDWQSDRIATEPDGARTLQGHVRVSANAVHVTRSGTVIVKTDVQPVIAHADRAVLTAQRGGGFILSLENGSVQY